MSDDLSRTDRPSDAERRPVAAERRPGGGAWRAFVLGIVGGLIGAGLVAGILYATGSLTRTAAPSSTQETTVDSDLEADQPVEAVAARVVPSVVNVAITQASAFGTVSGNGSGIILRSNGYILTNYHVVSGATSIVVRLGTKDYTARVVGTDSASDLAVIKVAATGLPPAAIGKSADLVVGQVVIAVGSPFGLDKTVTEGIISALHRSDLGTGAAAYTNLIQTDAAINPGNSGGGLFDVFGKLIGINTLIESPAGQFGTAQSAGIGFAIPIDYAESIADQIIAGKKVVHPYLGVSSVSVDEQLATQFHLSVNSGALVQTVAAGSPAAAAGVHVGDIITSVGGQTVTTSDELLAAVRNFSIGQRVAIVLIRNGKQLTVEATIGSK